MSVHKYNSWGRTRRPKAAISDGSGSVCTTADALHTLDIANTASNISTANGIYKTENQRYMHLLLDSSTSNGGNKNVRIAALGYINAFGIWSELLKYDGDNLPKIETSLQNGTAEYYVFDILGVDRVLFFATNNNADDISDWQLRAAFSTF